MDISVIVVSFNTQEITRSTLDAIQKSFSLTPHLKWELIVVDNASVDGSVEMLHAYTPHARNCTYHVITSKENLGFGGGNNLGIRKAKGNYILLLNSDLIADSVDFAELTTYLEKHPNVGGLTVRVELPGGSIDPASHRGFPTPWRSFCYFSKLQALTKHVPLLNRFFGGYHLTHLDLNTIHEIDSPTAAFFMIRGPLLHDLNGFDEDFFLYGEDIDLAMRIRRAGYSIVYYPRYTVLHLKHQSGLKTKKKKTQSTATYHFYNAMKIFYDKHYASRYPKILTWFIHKAIDVMYSLAKH